jgi:fatty acid CoA ligase FadD9
VFSYEQLFAPNVLGTAAIIELALTERRKAIHFVSTIGVAARVRRHASVRESEQARTLWTRRVIETSDYAGGYGTSKWAAELLLDQARERGCPVTISRCSMILPHREHAEELNPGDSFTRLLFGLARTGCAPESFYADSAAHHYDGLPVDVVAGVIAALPFRADAGGIYHVSNASASLDAIAEWTGFALERLPYAAWFETFRQRLEALPEAERRRSPLAIVERWSRSGTIDDEIALETTRFRGLLDDVPELTEAYIARCARAIGRP